MNVLIVDNHPLIHDAVESAIREALPVQEIHFTLFLEHAISLLKSHTDSIHIVVLEPILPDSTGIEAIEACARCAPHARIAVLSAASDHSTILASIEAGAQGYIPKSASSLIFKLALQIIAAGARYVPPEVLAGLKEMSKNTGSVVEQLNLTERQQAVMEMMLMGMPNKAICATLGIAESTVKIHMGAVLRALRASNRTEAAINAAKIGIRATAIMRIPLGVR